MPSCRPTAYQGRADGSGDPSGHSGSIPGSIRSETGRGSVGSVMGLAAESERGQVALQLELGDVAAVLVPLLALVAQEVVIRCGDLGSTSGHGRRRARRPSTSAVVHRRWST